MLCAFSCLKPFGTPICTSIYMISGQLQIPLTRPRLSELHDFRTITDTPNTSQTFRFVAFVVLEILGGQFRPPSPLVLGVGTKPRGARRVNAEEGIFWPFHGTKLCLELNCAE